MRKTRRYDEGGVTEGENPRIDEDTRARARKFIEDASEESRDIKPRAEAKSTSKSSSKAKEEPKAKTASKSEWDDNSKKIPSLEPKEKAREEPYSKPTSDSSELPEKPLEEVHPEDVPLSPIGLAKNLARRATGKALKTVERQALSGPKSGVPALEKPTPRLSSPSGAAETPRLSAPKEEIKTPAQKGQATKAANKVRRSEEGFSPEEALKARKKAGYKSGGSVKVAGKLATRGYGKAR